MIAPRLTPDERHPVSISPVFGDMSPDINAVRSNRRRRFTLLDLLDFVAFTAVGIGVARFFILHPNFYIYGSHPRVPGEKCITPEIYRIVFICSIFIGAWSLAILPSALIRPRPRIRRLLIQPGITPGIGMLMLTSLAGLFAAAVLLSDPKSRPYYLNNIVNLVMPYYVKVVMNGLGLAIAVAWGMLAASGRWRPDGGWVDRCGRTLGIVWIICSLATVWLSI
jgi:hypothetical protein